MAGQRFPSVCSGLFGWSMGLFLGWCNLCVDFFKLNANFCFAEMKYVILLRNANFCFAKMKYVILFGLMLTVALRIYNMSFFTGLMLPFAL